MHLIRRLNVRLAAAAMLVLFACTTLFHLLVLAGVVPYGIVWGGRLENAGQMYLFETLSLTINFTLMTVVAVRAGFIGPLLSGRSVTVILGLAAGMFLLNTVGNLFAQTDIERLVGTPLTLISALLCLRLVLKP